MFLSSTRYAVLKPIFTSQPPVMSLLISKFRRSSTSRQVDGEIEFKACKTNEIKENEFKTVQKGDYEVLISKYKGQIYATGSKCTHYGAPLAKGVFKDGRFFCPWHSACFDVQTGDVEDFPAFSPLPCYKVHLKGNDVWIRGKKDSFMGTNTVPLKPRKEKTCEKFVIVGSGPAGFQCASSLRELGYTGNITMITRENFYPYDRTKLSKALDHHVENYYIRPPEEFKKADIEIKTSSPIRKLDTQQKNVTCKDGICIPYDKIFMATGVNPRKLEVPGSHLENILYLREPHDAELIKKNFTNKDVIICGTSFIGLEVASFIHKNVKSLTMVGKSKYPGDHVLGEVIGKSLQELYEASNIKFYNQASISQFQGHDSQAKNGPVKYAFIGETKLPCDICIVGIGALPVNDIVRDTPIKLADSGHIIVNDRMETNVENVYAGGDVSTFPLKIYNIDRTPINHWQIAQFHGKIAAHSMLKKPCKTETVPCFWMNLLGKNMRYAGFSSGYEDIIISGSVENWKFVAQFIKNKKVVAVITCGYDPLASLFRAMMMKGKWIKEEETGGVPPQWSIEKIPMAQHVPLMIYENHVLWESSDLMVNWSNKTWW